MEEFYLDTYFKLSKARLNNQAIWFLCATGFKGPQKRIPPFPFCFGKGFYIFFTGTNRNSQHVANSNSMRNVFRKLTFA